MAFTERIGLAATADTGDTLAERDVDQLVACVGATRTVLAHLLGGEGVHAGLAALVDTGTDGTKVQAGTGADQLIIAVNDDSGYTWWFRFTSDQTITFNAASGTLNLYAVVSQTGGVSPAFADGGLTDCDFVADTVAPAHSFLLGSGSVTASAFTSWTEDGSARPTPFRVPKLVAAPASASADGRPGEVAEDDSYLYVCISADTWKRVAIATWS